MDWLVFTAVKEEQMIDKELLDILACPACKGDVELKDNKIVCKICAKKYPIKDGIPIMLIDEAEE
jgi:hypothetical protein